MKKKIELTAIDVDSGETARVSLFIEDICSIAENKQHNVTTIFTRYHEFSVQVAQTYDEVNALIEKKESELPKEWDGYID